VLHFPGRTKARFAEAAAIAGEWGWGWLLLCWLVITLTPSQDQKPDVSYYHVTLLLCSETPSLRRS